MKTLAFKIPKPSNSELIFQEDIGTQLYPYLHQHEEIQLSCIVEGEGDLVVGDNYSRYLEGDIICIDSKVPHLFNSDTSSASRTYMISLFFTESTFGPQFFQLRDLKALRSFFQKLKQGIRLREGAHPIQRRFLSMKSQNEFQRFLIFLQLLHEIGTAHTTKLLQYDYSSDLSENEGKRMSEVMDYTFGHYQHPILLQDIAAVANLSPNAFCRFFKKRTNKSYVQFLIEIRIEKACQLLAKQRDYSVTEISELVGFRNLSNFNRKFKQLKGVSPLAYRKEV